MDAIIATGFAAADVVPDSPGKVDVDQQTEIDRELAPTRGTIIGLFIAGALWAIMLTPAWFYLFHQ